MGARHANKRSSVQRVRDRAEIAQTYLRGEPQHAIAQRLGLSRQQIGYDLQLIRAEWRQSAMRDFEAHKAEELAKLDAMEAEYWAAWQRSQQELVHSTEEHVDDEIAVPSGKRHGRMKVPRSRSRVSQRTEAQHGNSAFLFGIERCIEQRCKILGLFAPTDVNVSGGLSFGELFELAQESERPRLEILAGSGAWPSADHDGDGHHRADALLPDGHQ
ncbi:MAG TPA: helix-turn-helix domain-containing protein [Chloroflexota bacterium]|nr:helix-turn-helix domain-containing protein [Chloroflexota bacterium]